MGNLLQRGGSTKAAALCDLNLLDGYPVRISDEQALHVLGPVHAKKTLTWADVCRHKRLTFRALLAAGIPASDLHVLQPDLDQWVRLCRVTLDDCGHLELWGVDPFRHFRCNVGNLATHRQSISPALLKRAGYTVTTLVERHGLTAQLMGLLKYSIDEWLELGLSAEHVAMVTPKEWTAVFGPNLRREDVLGMVARSPTLY